LPKTTLHPHVFPTCCRVAPLPLPSLPHMLLQQQRRVPPNSSNTSPVHEFCLMQGHPACRFCRTRFYDSNDPPNQATPHSRVRHSSCRATPSAVSAAPASTTATTPQTKQHLTRVCVTTLAGPPRLPFLPHPLLRQQRPVPTHGGLARALFHLSQGTPLPARVLPALQGAGR